MIHRIRKLQQQHRLTIGRVTRFSTYLLGFFVFCLIYWIDDNFGEPSIEQMLYHLQFGAEGLVDTDTGILKDFVSYCLWLPLLLAFAAMLLEKLMRYARRYALGQAFGTDNSPVNEATAKLFRVLDWSIGHRAPLYLLLIAIACFGVKFSVTTYIHNQFGRDYFAENYVYPENVTLHAQHTKNLVLIYVESMEDSYREPKLFGKNLLASLDKLGGTSFKSYRQAPGTGWTIAGITATQCGVPLKSVTMFDGNNQGERIKSFLPNATCMSDILNKLGYRNIYMGSDALAFSGKGKFFEDHHYDEVYGREELKGHLGPADMNFWGLYDDDLLAKVRAKLKQLHEAGQPFNLTFTTIDTHGPDGHYSKYCRQHGVKNFAGIVECTSNQVADFVKFIKNSGYLKDTNVVILGDHLAMENPVYDRIEKIRERHIYNNLISADKSLSKNRDNIVHFDLFPTMLEFIGIHAEGDRLGLGYSAITKGGQLPPAHEYEDMKADLLNRSDAYRNLWAKPKS